MVFAGIWQYWINSYTQMFTYTEYSYYYFVICSARKKGVSILVCQTEGFQSHDNFMTWKCFLHYWLFVRGIHQGLVDSPVKGPVMQSFDDSFDVSLNKLLNKQSRGRWIKMSWHSYDVIVRWCIVFIYIFQNIRALTGMNNFQFFMARPNNWCQK